MPTLKYQKRAYCLQIKPQCCLIILNLPWLDTTNSMVYVLLESIDLMLLKLTRVGIKGHRKLRMVLRHSRLDRHVHQTKDTAIGKYSRLVHRQAKYIAAIPVIIDIIGKEGLKSRHA